MSLEVISSYPNSVILIVEGNPLLSSNLHLTISSNFRKAKRWEVINAIVPFGGKSALFNHSIDSLSSGADIILADAKVNQFDFTHALNKKFKSQPFSLVSDIEGAEYYFIFEHPELLERCVEICIELHPVIVMQAEISIEMFISRLETLGFTLVDQSQRAFYFQKNKTY
jgi:hypothetical protein